MSPPINLPPFAGIKKFPNSEIITLLSNHSKMTAEQDPYYGRPEASNSDLSALAKYWQSFQISYDIEAAFRFGTLLDCMLTEPKRVDYFRFTCCGVQYSEEEFALAEAMKRSGQANKFLKMLMENSDMQAVTIRKKFAITYLGFTFYLDFRMKADFNAKAKLRMLGDLKTTAAKTEKEFRAMIEAFSYDRQAAIYMDMEEVNMFVIIGISKTAPHQVFVVTIKRGEPLYLSGRAKYEELAYLYYTLFHHLKIAA